MTALPESCFGTVPYYPVAYHGTVIEFRAQGTQLDHMNLRLFREHHDAAIINIDHFPGSSSAQSQVYFTAVSSTSTTQDPLDMKRLFVTGQACLLSPEREANSYSFGPYLPERTSPQPHHLKLISEEGHAMSLTLTLRPREKLRTAIRLESGNSVCWLDPTQAYRALWHLRSGRPEHLHLSMDSGSSLPNSNDLLVTKGSLIDPLSGSHIVMNTSRLVRLWHLLTSVPQQEQP